MLNNLKSNLGATLAAALVVTVVGSAPALAASKTVTFAKGAILEITFVDLNHDRPKDVFDSYFANATKAVAKYGGSVVGKFRTFDVVEGDMSPRYVTITNWPSVKSFDGAKSDARISDFSKQSGKIVRSLKYGLFQIPKEVKVTFDESKVYEFFGANPASPKAPEMLGQFFQDVIPTAMTYGRENTLELMPVEYKQDSYNRMIAGVAGWPNAAEFYAFTNTTVFRKGVKELRGPAMKNLDIVNTHFIAN